MPTHRERHAKRAAAALETGAREADAAAAEMRLDKWLWAARFYKTRALAVTAIETSKVRRQSGEDSERCKPAHTVRIGDHYLVVRDNLTWNIEVIAVSEQRGSAAVATQLYRESPPSISARMETIAQRKAVMTHAPQWKGRPSKRQRRKIEDFLAEP